MCLYETIREQTLNEAKWSDKDAGKYEKINLWKTVKHIFDTCKQNCCYLLIVITVKCWSANQQGIKKFGNFIERKYSKGGNTRL
jgi:hypothetical protein